MNQKDLKRLMKFLKRSPSAFSKAAAYMLTGFAFGTNREARQIIHRKMTVRSPKFVDSSIKTVKAKGGVPLDKIKATTGSLERPRYTGLAEQELGTAPKHTRAFTRAGRGGVKTRTARGYARLKPNAKYPRPGGTGSIRAGGRSYSLSGLSGQKRIVAFLHILSERKVAQTFVIRRKFGRFKRGLYRFSNGVIKKLQSFDIKRKPKRIKWLTEGRENYFKSLNLKGSWANVITKQLKKIK